jgi:hypothetical protein
MIRSSHCTTRTTSDGPCTCRPLSCVPKASVDRQISPVIDIQDGSMEMKRGKMTQVFAVVEYGDHRFIRPSNVGTNSVASAPGAGRYSSEQTINHLLPDCIHWNLDQKLAESAM